MPRAYAAWRRRGTLTARPAGGVQREFVRGRTVLTMRSYTPSEETVRTA